MFFFTVEFIWFSCVIGSFMTTWLCVTLNVPSYCCNVFDKSDKKKWNVVWLTTEIYSCLPLKTCIHVALGRWDMFVKTTIIFKIYCISLWFTQWETLYISLLNVTLLWLQQNDTAKTIMAVLAILLTVTKLLQFFLWNGYFQWKYFHDYFIIQPV